MRFFSSILVLASLLAFANAKSGVISSGSHQAASGHVADFLRFLRKRVKAVTHREECDVLLEVAFVLDQTVSTGKVLSELSASMEKVIGQINYRFPGSRFGVSTFVDKPTATFVGENEYAWCLLTIGAIGSDPEELGEKVGGLIGTGGADQPENSMGAMVRAAYSKELGYSGNATDAETGKRIVKVMIMYSDALPHSADYFSRRKQLVDQPKLKKQVNNGHPLSFVEHVTKEKLAAEGEDYKCSGTEYPSFAEWAQVMKDEAIVPIVVTGNWTYTYHGKKFFPIEYHPFAEVMGNLTWSDIDDGLYNFWTSMLADYQVDGIVMDLDGGGASWTGDLLDNIERVPEIVC